MEQLQETNDLDQELESNETEAEQIETEQKPVRESVRETVERAHAELSKDAGSKDGDKETQGQSAEKADPGLKTDDKFDPELSPPQRLNAQQKEMFNNLPKGLKRAFHRAIRDQESHFTRTQQELVPKLREYQSIDEVVSPFLQEWAAQGVSKSQAIAQLVGVHAALKDPAQKVSKFRWLMQNCGITREELLGGEQEVSAAGVPNIEAHPVVQQLRNEIQSLQQQTAPILDSYSSAQSALEEQQIRAAQTEMSAVLDEKDATGRYLFPQLHDADFLQNRARPLVSALVENTPGLGYGQALKMAHDILVYGKPRDFGAVHQTKPPQQSITHSRQIAPSPSIRGRSASASAGSSGELPYVKGESARDTVRRVFESLSRG
jgi:hypothetical protein